MQKPFLIIFIGLIVLLGILFWIFSQVSFAEDKWMRLTSILLILTYLLVAFFSKKISAAESVKYILVWVGIGLVIMTGYAYRFELTDIKNRLAGEWLPSQGRESTPGEIHFVQANDGHYYVDAFVEGVPVRFMVDTGASRVVLTPRDADRIGFNLPSLSFTSRTSTANGDVWTASVRLKSIKVGSYTTENIPASISNDGLNISLLGMSYLEQLKGYRVEKGGLTFLY